MTYEEKLLYYATARRVTAGQITQYVDGNFVTKWAGRVRGKFVRNDKDFKFDTKPEALDFAREWLDETKKKAKDLGLLADKESGCEDEQQQTKRKG